MHASPSAQAPANLHHAASSTNHATAESRYLDASLVHRALSAPVDNWGKDESSVDLGVFLGCDVKNVVVNNARGMCSDKVAQARGVSDIIKSDVRLGAGFERTGRNLLSCQEAGARYLDPVCFLRRISIKFEMAHSQGELGSSTRGSALGQAPVNGTHAVNVLVRCHIFSRTLEDIISRKRRFRDLLRTTEALLASSSTSASSSRSPVTTSTSEKPLKFSLTVVAASLPRTSTRILSNP